VFDTVTVTVDGNTLALIETHKLFKLAGYWTVLFVTPIGTIGKIVALLVAIDTLLLVLA